MELACPKWAGRCSIDGGNQRGQALIYGLFVLLAGLAALFFVFNTGQLTQEKAKLVNAADATAYSAGIMNARLLNFDAYTNRAMVANTVAIAQLVSLASWVRYADRLGSNCTSGGDYSIPCEAEVSNTTKYPAFQVSYYAAEMLGSYLDDYLLGSSFLGTSVLEGLEKGSDNIIHNVLMNAQQVAYAGFFGARQNVINDVAQANYHDDGSVNVDLLPSTVSNDVNTFIKRYSGDQRTRFAEVAKTAANKDSFNLKRSWLMIGLYADCAAAMAFGRFDFLTRRGGTNLIGFDEWRAMDTLAEWRWQPASKYDVTCSAIAEHSGAYGLQDAADSPTTFDVDPSRYDSSIVVNPATSSLAQLTSAASSDSWGYKGLPSFYDLTQDRLNENDPRLLLAIRLRRTINQTRTSEGSASVHSTPRINKYSAMPAGGNELVAVSVAEVFFQRFSDAGQGISADNTYGKTIGKPVEIGSLFNPYWQVHLIQSDSNVAYAQSMQGVTLP